MGLNNIRRRKFEPDQSHTLAFIGEHYSQQPYDGKYSQKNLNNIKHLLDAQNNSLSIWESGLRGYKHNNRRYEEEGKKRVEGKKK